MARERITIEFESDLPPRPDDRRNVTEMIAELLHGRLQGKGRKDGAVHAVTMDPGEGVVFIRETHR